MKYTFDYLDSKRECRQQIVIYSEKVEQPSEILKKYFKERGLNFKQTVRDLKIIPEE